jgi:hypothetical protein
MRSVSFITDPRVTDRILRIGKASAAWRTILSNAALPRVATPDLDNHAQRRT